MKAHLTNEEMTERLLGAASEAVDTHLRECVACRSELERLGRSIGLFCDAANAWSERALDRTLVAKKVPAFSFSRKPRPRISWAWAGMAFVLLLALAVFQRGDGRSQRQAQSVQREPTSVAVATSPSQLAQDNELLSQVYSEISEGVPSPMQPLRISDSNESSRPAIQNK